MTSPPLHRRLLEAPAPLHDDGPTSRAVVLFVRMWAIAHIIHLSAANQSRLDTPWNIGVVVCALLLLRFPTHGRLLALMLAAQLVDMVVELPLSPDHWMLISAVNVVLLITMAVRRSTSVSTLPAAFPAARAVVLIAYGAAALSKYNTSFLDPVTSCASAIANAASFGLTPRLGIDPFWGLVTLACETAIPILLAIPATRRYGVRLGLGFHFALSASPAFAVVDFTAALYALFLLFLPTRELDAVLARISWVASKSAIARDIRRAPRVAMGIALLAFGFLGYLSPVIAAAVSLVPAEIYLLGMLLATLSVRPGRGGNRTFGTVSWQHVPVLVAVLMLAASPYLGFRTTGVFTMFSGIRTEGDAPNHLFLPSVRLVDWQDDLVVIDRSNDPELAGASGGKVGIPLLALRRLAEDKPALEVTGRLDGQEVVYGPGPGQTRLEPLPFWQSKLFLFRPVAVTDAPFCSNS